MTRILIVDDKEEDLYYLRALLSTEECDVDVARHGGEALELARRNPPDVVVSDLLMPVMDGFTLLRHWKSDERLKASPFIVYTATYTDPEDERLAMTLGADAFILKPSDPERLVTRLREAWAAAAGGTAAPRRPEPDETQRLTLYSQTLVRKLEERTEHLGTANKALEDELAERERAESERRKMLETQTAILEALPAHIALLDDQGVILAVNEAWRRFGRDNMVLSDGDSESDFVGQNYVDVCERATGDSADEAAAAGRGIRRVLRGEEKEFVIEYPCRSPDDQRWFRMIVTPMADGGGSGAVVMHVDITQRKAAEQEIKRTLHRLTEAQRIGKIGDWEWDIGSGRINWSRQVSELLGGDPDHELPTDFHSQLDLYEPESQAVMQEMVRRAIDTGEPGDCELVAVQPSGRRVDVQARAFPRRDEDGRVVGLYGTIQDITDSKWTEDALRESEETFAAAFRSGPMPLSITTLEGRYVEVNQAFCDLLGYRREDLIGKTATESGIISEETRNALIAEIERHGGSLSQAEVKFRIRDGSIRDIICSATTISLQGVKHLLSTGRDITERKRAELEISRTNRALKMLSGCNEVMTRAENETELLEKICRIAVESGGYHMAWVGYAQNGGSPEIKPMAHAGVEEGYLQEITISWSADDPAGKGPGGRCIRTGRKVICGDLAADASFAPWLAQAGKRGYRGLICLPLTEGERTFGMLSLYSAEVMRPSSEELKLLHDMAEDLAFGILGLRSRVERARTHDAVLTMARGLSATTGDRFFEELTRSMVEALGGYAGHVARLVSEEPATVRTISAVAGGQRVTDFQYTPDPALLRRDEVWVVERGAQCLHPQSRDLAEMAIESYVSTRLADASGRTIGLVTVQFQTPLEQVEFAQSTMKIFGARAASELERQRADARTREQAELLDKARDAIVVRDLDHRVVYWNKSAERLYGWTSEETAGRPFTELLTVDAEKFHEADRAVRRSGEWSGEIQKTSRDGALITLDSRWTLVRDAEGRPRSILVIDTDVTERVKIEQQFRRGQRMESIGTLAGGIAHDLNNVLTPIMMAIDLLQLDETDPERLAILSTIGGNAKRGAEMVQQVLSFARGVEGRRVEVDVGRLVSEVEKIANETFLKHIDVRTSAPPGLWTVIGDATQLHQVLLNLFVNSRDAMPGGGRLMLTARNTIVGTHDAMSMMDAKPGPHVCLHVEDNGTGMPPEVVEQIFDPFFTTKEHGSGTGLGLSTSLAIIKSHGGFIRIYSEPGAGTTFKVYLPARTEASGGTAEEAAAELPRGRGELVLVVDDEEAVRQITRRTLEAFGYRVVLAGNGAEAVEIFKERRREIDVVLTDMMMPVMDGLTSIALLREMDPGARIVAASGLSAREHLVGAEDLKVKHFLSKPYTAETLLTTLREVLEQRS